MSDLQSAGETGTAVTWLAELITDPATTAPRRLRLRQLLAWLVTAEPHLQALVPDDAGPVPDLRATQRTGSALPPRPRKPPPDATGRAHQGSASGRRIRVASKTAPADPLAPFVEIIGRKVDAAYTAVTGRQ